MADHPTRTRPRGCGRFAAVGAIALLTTAELASARAAQQADEPSSPPAAPSAEAEAASAEAEAPSTAGSPPGSAGEGDAGATPTAPSQQYSGEELEELEELGDTVRRFESRAKEYREATRKLIDLKYSKKRDLLHKSYEDAIVKLEKEQRRRRREAIAKFESFLERYPADEEYTPSAMFRLSELYFERSYDEYFQARQTFDKALEAWEPESDEPEPAEPMLHYEPTIASMQRLITEFPDYRLIDGAYYLLGYCLGEQGEDERAVTIYEELVARRPDSRFTPEVWTRIGEFYFNSNELERALAGYSKVLEYPDSPFYDKAIYKLAWTHYRLADPERAPEEFQLAVDTFVELLEFNERTKAAGRERGGDLRSESIQYIAICYADEQWGSTEKALAYFEERPDRPYERDVIKALGDVYFDQTRFDEAVRVYEVVQERFSDHPDGPNVQEKIVTALERNRAFEAAAEARAILTRNYSAGTDWYEKNQDNPDALRAADKKTEKSLHSAALFHHRQAQIHKEAEKLELAKDEYGKAAESYRNYLTRFPHARDLYELTYYLAECLYYSLQFEEAASSYVQVRDATAGEQFLEESAFSVILSVENMIKVAEGKGETSKLTLRKSTDRDPEAPVEAQPIPELRQQFVAASDRYAELAPGNEKVPRVLYKAAEVFYGFDHFEEARKRFASIIETYPEHEVAQFASNLTIESYLTQKDFSAVELFSRRMLQTPQGSKRGKFAGELTKFKTGAMFKIADDLANKQKHEEAAAMYLKLIDENPTTEFADSALNNAAVAYEQVKRYDSASRLYERLVNEHSRSPLADTALFRVGFNAERFFDFGKAVEAYTTLVKRYPKSERRADSIYNSALALENMQDYERSAKQYLRYCKLFPKREDAPTVCFRAGAVYDKMGDTKRVISTYKDFIKKYRKTKSHQDRVIEARLRIAKAYAALKKKNDAEKYYKATVKEFGRGADPKSAPYAAEAQFQLVERDFAAFKRLTIEGRTKQQQKALKAKAKRLKKVEKSYQDILRYKQIDWTLAALYRIGQLYQNFAESLINSPCPPDVRRAARRMQGISADEVCDEYRIALEERSAGIEDKAVLAFETTVGKARELQVVNKWTKQTLVQLNRLRRSQWPLQKDAKHYFDVNTVAIPEPIGLNGSRPASVAHSGAGEPPTQEQTTEQGETAAPAGTSVVPSDPEPEPEGKTQRPAAGGSTNAGPPQPQSPQAASSWRSG